MPGSALQLELLKKFYRAKKKKSRAKIAKILRAFAGVSVLNVNNRTV